MTVVELLDAWQNWNTPILTILDNHDEVVYTADLNPKHRKQIPSDLSEDILDSDVRYWSIDKWKLKIVLDYFPYEYDDVSVNSSMRIKRGKSVMASSWKAPNGKKYGKQTNRFPGKYLFTRKELRDMVDSGIAEDMAGTFDPMAMNYDIIGISWNETNGYRSGILIEDRDTGELYVGNSGDATRARL